MPARLQACPACARHIRVDEPRCPFCRADLPRGFGAGPAPTPPPRGLSRAGIRRFNALAAAGAIGSGMAFAAMVASPLQAVDVALVGQATVSGDVRFE